MPSSFATAAPTPINKVEEIFTRFQKANPTPRGELEYVNVYTLLVAVVLSARATDKSVNKVTRTLFAVADTPEKMIQLGEKTIYEHVKTVGLAPTKAKNILALSHKLLSDFNGAVPEGQEELESLPGVGHKTANVVRNSAFGKPTIAVDTHVFRVSNRLPLAVGKQIYQVEEGLEAVIPQEFKQKAHHWLVLHGRYICTARNPRCRECLLEDLCTFEEKNLP